MGSCGLVSSRHTAGKIRGTQRDGQHSVSIYRGTSLSKMGDWANMSWGAHAVVLRSHNLIWKSDGWDRKSQEWQFHQSNIDKASAGKQQGRYGVCYVRICAQSALLRSHSVFCKSEVWDRKSQEWQCH